VEYGRVSSLVLVAKPATLLDHRGLAHVMLPLSPVRPHVRQPLRARSNVCLIACKEGPWNVEWWPHFFGRPVLTTTWVCWWGKSHLSTLLAMGATSCLSLWHADRNTTRSCIIIYCYGLNAIYPIMLPGFSASPASLSASPCLLRSRCSHRAPSPIRRLVPKPLDARRHQLPDAAAGGEPQ
jgi:hypothetical protein